MVQTAKKMDYKLCRLCYEREANSSIFQRKNEGRTVSKLMYCCKSIRVRENDGLPSKICSWCDRELEACYQFLLMCEASERNLRLILRETQTSQAAHPDDIRKTEVKSEYIDEEYKPDALQPGKHAEYIEDKVINQNKTKKSVKTKKENLICSVCARKCISASVLAIHMRTHTNEKPYQCPSCVKKYKDSGTLKRHIERNHLQHRERRFICENCGKGFYSKSDITIHMRVHTGETPYTCSICLSRFTQMSAMLRHKRRHTGSKSHVCSTCGKLFWTKEELKKHHSVHNDVRSFECPICNVQFKQKSNIKKHMAIHADPNRYVCNYCGQTFTLKGNLKSHISRKHSEKSGYCNNCCKNVSNIEIHMWRHTGQRPLKCEFCPSSFYEMKALALHINFKHKKTDRFKCTSEGCNQGFPSKPMMMYHIARFHDMQTPYPCDRCSRGFYRKNDLSRHKIGTHKERLL